MFADLEALRAACAMLGLEVVEQRTYRWYGTSVGDYPLPAGMKAGELGRNATYVIRFNEEMRKKHPQAYEVGLIADPNNPGAFVPLYDYWNSGYGINTAVGAPLLEADRKTVKMLCPRLKQHYDMCCDALAAKQAGDSIEFLTLADAHRKYPQQFPASTDAETWVSVVDPTHRVPLG